MGEKILIMNEGKNQCPKCGSAQFITDPNQYDVLEFNNGVFDIIRSESTADEFKIFCGECFTEIDQDTSVDENQIILKTDG